MKLACLLETGVDAGEPLFSEVFGIQTDPGVHEKSAEAHFVKEVDLSDQFVLVQFGIPRPERHSPEFFAGRTEVIKKNASEILSRADVTQLIETLKKEVSELWNKYRNLFTSSESAESA